LAGCKATIRHFPIVLGLPPANRSEPFVQSGYRGGLRRFFARAAQNFRNVLQNLCSRDFALARPEKRRYQICKSIVSSDFAKMVSFT